MISDQTNPTITCGSDVVSRVTSVSYNGPTANDNIDQTLTISCSHPSPGTFTVGQTTVTCTATDDAMNMGTCTLIVTVGKNSYKTCEYRPTFEH